MKITKIELNDFRAFAHPESFDLGDGKNVLLYGANGAGKSSLFRALKEIFDHASTEPFSVHKNIFTDPTHTDGHVKIHFSESAAPPAPNAPVEWPFLPGPRPSGDQRIIQGAMRLGALDYRALLDTNYVFKDGEINLFELLVEGILRPWMVNVADPAAPRLERLEKLWEQTLGKKIRRPRHRLQWRIDAANLAADVFNTTLKAYLRRLVRRSNGMLRRLGMKRFFFNLKFQGVIYDNDLRDFGRCQIGIDVWHNRVKLSKPQLFLNEARLSALAIALYFSALIEVVPDDPTWPRILVLDDVLIGLDMDNRLPVLDILRHEFRDWQVFLLTHDRTWFELAQLATEDDEGWASFEMYPRPEEMFNHRIVDVPCKQEIGDSPAEHFLNRAKSFLAMHDDRSAAFYARAAFEAKLKGYCHAKKVHVAYDLSGHKLTTEDFMEAIERRLTSSGKMPRARFQFARVRMFRKGVLNPLAHFHPVTISPGEVELAIEAVAALEFPGDDNVNIAKETDLLLRKAALTPSEILVASCWLRTTFEINLRELLTRLAGMVAFRHDWNKLPLADLWTSAKTAMQTRNLALATPFITGIELHPSVFLDEFTYARVSAFGKPVLDAAWAVLRDPAHPNPVKTRLATFP